MEFFAVASSGTEKALQKELIELGFNSVRLNTGGIPFLGEISDGWRACLYSRIAQRIYIVISRFQCLNENELYNNVKKINWAKYLTPEHTLAVAAFCHSSNLNNSSYISRKVKDAIVDNLREKFASRPNVDKDNPDIRVFLFLGNNKATLYLDMSGEPLFQRGYRIEKGEAPLKETIASAMLMYSDWDRTTPLWDPMCGSGTIPIEAALWARNIAPGIFREKFGFERWADFTSEDTETMRVIRGEARRNLNSNMPVITASDNNHEILEIAKNNARRAGIRLSFKLVNVENLQANNTRRFIVTNPPFDKRFSIEKDFYRQLGASLSRMHGSRLALICSNPSIYQYIPYKRIKEIPMKNGNLECILSVYEIL